jgi:hypothetical protein
MVSFEGHTGYVTAAALSPNGATLCTTSLDRTACAWTAATGERVRRFDGRTGAVHTATLSPSGNVLYTTSADATARAWDTTTGDTVHVFRGHTRGVNRAALSPDGAVLYTTSGDCTACAWDTTAGACVRTFRGHTNWVFNATLSRDGSVLYTTSRDSTARAWSTATGVNLRTFEGRTGSVQAMAVSPDGAVLYTASADGTARSWHVGRYSYNFTAGELNQTQPEEWLTSRHNQTSLRSATYHIYRRPTEGRGEVFMKNEASGMVHQISFPVAGDAAEISVRISETDRVRRVPAARAGENPRVVTTLKPAAYPHTDCALCMLTEATEPLHEIANALPAAHLHTAVCAVCKLELHTRGVRCPTCRGQITAGKRRRSKRRRNRSSTVVKRSRRPAKPRHRPENRSQKRAISSCLSRKKPQRC